MSSLNSQKTGKRELAIALLLTLGIVGYLALSSQQALKLFDLLRWPVFTFSAAAFGLDAVAKQWSAK